MKRFIAIAAAALLMAALFVGCGSASVAGKYVVKTIDGKTVEDSLNESLEEMGMSIEDYLELLEIPSLDEFMFMELKEDGTATVVMMGEDSETGTWKQDGDKVTVTIDDDPIEFALKNGELSVDVDGQALVYAKK